MGAPHYDFSCGFLTVYLTRTLFHMSDTWIPLQCCEFLSESWAVPYWWKPCHTWHSGGVCLWSGSVDVLLFVVCYKPSHRTRTPPWIAEDICCFWLVVTCNFPYVVQLTSHVCNLLAWNQKDVLRKYFYIMNSRDTNNDGEYHHTSLIYCVYQGRIQNITLKGTVQVVVVVVVVIVVIIIINVTIFYIWI